MDDGGRLLGVVLTVDETELGCGLPTKEDIVAPVSTSVLVRDEVCMYCNMAIITFSTYFSNCTFVLVAIEKNKLTVKEDEGAVISITV